MIHEDNLVFLDETYLEQYREEKDTGFAICSIQPFGDGFKWFLEEMESRNLFDTVQAAIDDFCIKYLGRFV